jgi:hypothetical protein
MATCHTARAQHSDHLTTCICHILDANAAVAANPHMLQMAVVDEGQRFAILDRCEQDQATKEAGTRAVFLLRHHAVVIGLIDHVGFHPDGKVAGGRTAFTDRGNVHLDGSLM